MSQLVPCTESPAVRMGIRMHVYDSTVFVTYDLRFATSETPVVHFHSDAMGNRLQFDVRRIGDPKFS